MQLEAPDADARAAAFPGLRDGAERR